MSIVKKRTSDFLPSLSRFFSDDFFTRDWGLSNFSNTETTLPAVNIRETEDTFEVEMAAPGMTKKDFNIELDGNLLTISSEKTDQREDGGGKYSRREFSYQSFQRTFNLPKEVVDVDKINATYQDGVLRLLIPKKEEAKKQPRKTINIS